MKKIFVFILLAWFVFVSSALAGSYGKEIKVAVLMPPEFTLTGVKTLRVESFSGMFGKLVSAKLVEEIKAKQIGEDNKALKKAMPGMEKGLNAQVFDEVLLAQSGKAHAFITGNVMTVGPSDSTYMDSKMKWSADPKVSIRTGSAVPGSSEKSVICTKRTAQYTARMLVNKKLKGGAKVVLFEGYAVKSFEQTKCKGQCCLKDEAEIFEELAEKVAPELAKRITPYYVVKEYQFRKGDGTNKYIRLAHKGQLSQAAIGLKELIAKDYKNISAQFNLGLCHELVGNYTQALEYYKRALNLKKEPEITSAIRRVEKRKKQVRKLMGFGMKIVPTSF